MVMVVVMLVVMVVVVELTDLDIVHEKAEIVLTAGILLVMMRWWW